MSGAYNAGVNGINNGSIDFLADTIKVLLIDSTYSYDPDHEFVSDIVADEVPSATRQTLGSKTVTKDNTNNRSVIDAANPTFPTVPGTVSVLGAVVFKDTGADATSTLLAFISAAGTTNGGDVTIAFSADGILRAQI